MPSPTGSRRVCLLTGAGGRLGTEFCRRFSGEYEIVAVCRRRTPDVPSQSESFIDPLDPAARIGPSPVFVVRADLEQPGAVEHVVDVVLARYDKVDLLVNNAAFSRWHPNGLVDGDAALADADRHFAVNVTVPLRLSVRLAQRFWTARAAENREQNRNIVNVSSLAGSKVFGGGQAIYAASKAAQNQLTRHQAREFDSFGVRVNGLAPDSFPERVSTRSVADAIVRLDRETVTGRILAVEPPSA